MSECNTDLPTYNPNVKKTWHKSVLTKEDIEKWNKAKAIASKAIDEIAQLGLVLHVNYRDSFYMQFIDQREFENNQDELKRRFGGEK